MIKSYKNLLTFIISEYYTESKGGEKYDKKGFNLLQREIELYKKKINYNRLKAEMDKEIKRMTIGLPENFFKNNNESE